MQALELTAAEIEQVSGGINTNETGIGLAVLGIGLGIAAVSGIGLLGIAAAGIASYAGGVMVGDGGYNNGYAFGQYFQ